MHIAHEKDAYWMMKYSGGLEFHLFGVISSVLKE